MAQALRDAGVNSINISLDTLDRERFRAITRRDDLRRVLTGIERAISVGFEEIKLNAVAIKGLTEPDLIQLVRFGRERNKGSERSRSRRRSAPTAGSPRSRSR